MSLLFYYIFYFPMEEPFQPYWFLVAELNYGGWIYKAGNFVFSPVSSLRSWGSQFSHLFLWKLRNPVYLAQVCIVMTGRFLTPGFKGQGQLWHSVYKTLWTWYRLQFLPITLKLHMHIVDNERRNPIDIGLLKTLEHCMFQVYSVTCLIRTLPNPEYCL